MLEKESNTPDRLEKNSFAGAKNAKNFFQFKTYF